MGAHLRATGQGLPRSRIVAGIRWDLVSSLRPVRGTAVEVLDLLRAWDAEPDEPEPLVVETSGSTGVPKRVQLSRRAVRASIEGTAQRLGATGPALGLLAEQRFDVGRAQLAPGEVLLGYTDGVVEAAGGDGAFGEARLHEALGAQATHSSELLLQRVEAALDGYSQQAAAADDITMVALRRAMN